MWRLHSVFVAILILAFAGVNGEAAVRKCGAHIASEVISAKSEFEAKRLALSQWGDKARKRGNVAPTWRLAADRVLKCAKSGDHFECVAIGRPCAIVQNPKSLNRELGPEDSI